MPHEYETADCIKWYVAREMNRAGVETPRDRLFRLQAEDLEITLAQKRGQLVPAADLRPRLKAVVIAAREALRNEAPRLSGLVVGLDRQACEDLLRESHETFLRKLARLELAVDGADAVDDDNEDDDE
jgi:hypothetical protein